MKDQLYLLRPGFMDGDQGPFYCGDSAPVEGLLGFYPQLRELVDVHYIDFPRPRTAVVDLIGTANQSMPVLILASAQKPTDETIVLGAANDRSFINKESDIRQYLSTQYGLGLSR